MLVSSVYRARTTEQVQARDTQDHPVTIGPKAGHRRETQAERGEPAPEDQRPVLACKETHPAKTSGTVPTYTARLSAGGPLRDPVRRIGTTREAQEQARERNLSPMRRRKRAEKQSRIGRLNPTNHASSPVSTSCGTATAPSADHGHRQANSPPPRLSRPRTRQRPVSTTSPPVQVWI